MTSAQVPELQKRPYKYAIFFNIQKDPKMAISFYFLQRVSKLKPNMSDLVFWKACQATHLTYAIQCGKRMLKQDVATRFKSPDNR